MDKKEPDDPKDESDISQKQQRQREMLQQRFAGRTASVRSADSDLIAENDPCPNGV